MSSEGSGPGRTTGARDQMDPPFDPDLDLIVQLERTDGPDGEPLSWWRRFLGL